jgi:hypothetical protein
MPSFIRKCSNGVGARPHSGPWLGRIGAFLSLATAVAILAGCGAPWSGTETANNPTVRTDELAVASGRPCPEDLLIGDDPSGHGFGTEEPANEIPALLSPQEAWLCQYNTVEKGTTSSGGAVYGWRRAAQPDTVDADDLPGLEAALDDLAPADRSGACNDDLGPRWMVVYSHDGDLTGVVIDDYGCRDVRLTDNPHTTPPGADDQEGTVGGVLDGGLAVLDAVGVGRSD